MLRLRQLCGMLIIGSLLWGCGCRPVAMDDGGFRDELSNAKRTADSLVEQLAGAKLEAVVPGHSDDLPERIAAFCGDCHAVPKPDMFERHVWYDEIRKGYAFYAQSGRLDLDPPPLEQVVRYYLQKAPQELLFPTPPEVDVRWRDRFKIDKIDWKDGDYISPGVSSLMWAELMEPGLFHLLVTDMRDGSISLVNPNPDRTSRTVLARLNNPARVTVADVDSDGRRDLIVADLGSFNPYDHEFGAATWLRRLPDSAAFEARPIVKGRGRVADVVFEDFAQSNQKDFILAEFGHRKRGGVYLVTMDDLADPANVDPLQAIDHRPGCIRILPHDWDGDGKMDFAAVFSQQFESVELFLNRDGRFLRHPIWTANDFSFGSVAIEKVDLDEDGDMDILVTNGDCLDNYFANLSHGLQWLENRGGLEFKSHRIGDFPGAYKSMVGDMDDDGDLDIVSVAYLPQSVEPKSLRESNPVSIMLFEQTSEMKFTARALERGSPRYPALDIADFNSDGKLDFAVGVMLFNSAVPESLPRLAIWWQKNS